MYFNPCYFIVLILISTFIARMQCTIEFTVTCENNFVLHAGILVAVILYVPGDTF